MFVALLLSACGEVQRPPLQDPKPLVGQIMTDPEDPSWLVRNQDSDGDGLLDSFFMAGPGDPEDFLYRGELNPDGTRNGDQNELIEKLVASGANCVYIQSIRSHGGDGDESHNPFVNNDPSQGVNQAVFRQWQEWFSLLDRNDIAIFFIIYDDNAEIWSSGNRIDPAEENYIKSVVNEFKGLSNIIWCVAEEYSEGLSKRRASRIARLIRETDEHGHLVAIHQHTGVEFDFKKDPNFSQFAIQYNVDGAYDIYNGLLRAWKDSVGKYNLNMAESEKHIEGGRESVRRKSWASAMGGANVMVYRMDIANTTSDILEDHGRIREFFESTDLTALRPARNLAHGETEFVLARTSELLIAYSSKATTGLEITLDMGGDFEWRWYDPITGEYSNTIVGTLDKGLANFALPAKFNGEVALVIARSKSVSD